MEPGDMTDAQLEAVLNQSREDNTGGLDYSEIEVEDPEAAESAEGDEAEADGESDGEPQEAEGGDEEPAEAADKTEEPDPIAARLDDLANQNDRLVALLEAERGVRDRLNGRIGSLMQRLDRLEKDRSAASSDDLDDSGDREATPRRDDAGQQALEQIRRRELDESIAGAMQEFWTKDEAVFFNEARETLTQDQLVKLTASLKEGAARHLENLGEDIYEMAPDTAVRVSKAVFRAALAEAKGTVYKDLLKEAARRANASTESVRERKKGAAGVRSNKRPVVESAQPQKPLHELSDAELDKLFRSAKRDL